VGVDLIMKFRLTCDTPECHHEVTFETRHGGRSPVTGEWSPDEDRLPDGWLFRREPSGYPNSSYRRYYCPSCAKEIPR